MAIDDPGRGWRDVDRLRPSNAASSERGYPYVAIPELRDGRLDLRSARQISPQAYAEWTRKAKPQDDDVVLSRRCNPGETAVVPRGAEFALGQNLVLLRTNGERVFPGFLRWLVRGPEWWQQVAKFINVGAVFDSLRCADIPRFELHIPPLGEQVGIARTLGALDDKIGLNQRMSATLDSLALALFARVTGREEGGSPLSALAEHIEVARGLSYTGAGLGSGLPLHNLNSIREGGGYKRDGIKHYAGEYKERHLVRPGEIVVANTEQAHTNTLIGYPAMVPARFGEVGLFSHHLYRVRIREGSPLTPSFAYLLLRSESLRSVVAGYRNGTTVAMLPAEALARPTFPLPSADRIRALDAQVTPLLAKIEANEDENETLAALRDALLPRLISGELRVRPSGPVVAATA